MSTQPQEPWYNRWYVWLIPWAVLVGLLYIAIQLSPTPVPFRAFTYNDVVELLTGMVLIALFLERTLEVLITTWRGPGATDLSNRVDKAKQLADEAKQKVDAAASLSMEELEAKQAEYRQVFDALNAAEREASSYKSRTQRLALWTSLLIGIAISAVGVRGIQPLMDPITIEGLSPFQIGAFHIVDVLITGGLIGGGSEGIHKIVAVFSDFFDKTRTQLKNS